jgi:leucyl/phenylalanyl-tRNA--protein transferase
MIPRRSVPSRASSAATLRCAQPAHAARSVGLERGRRAAAEVNGTTIRKQPRGRIGLVIPWLERDDPFPPLSRALDEPNGLLAAGGTLEPLRLIDAYRRGIFPWSGNGQPILWWSPDPRMVLRTGELRVARSLGKRVRARTFEIRIDTAFDHVVAACAEPREGQAGTWITTAMQHAYGLLHRMGYAHSVEAWREGRLVGGLYGVALGRVFYGESMFARDSDASKVALVHLVALLQRQNVPLIDCQQETAHLASFGARPMRRDAFAASLGELINSPAPPSGWTPGPWAGPQP